MPQGAHQGRCKNLSASLPSGDGAKSRYSSGRGGKKGVKEDRFVRTSWGGRKKKKRGQVLSEKLKN